MNHVFFLIFSDRNKRCYVETQRIERNFERIDLALEGVTTIIEALVSFADDVLEPILTKKDMDKFDDIIQHLTEHTDNIEDRVAVLSKSF